MNKKTNIKKKKLRMKNGVKLFLKGLVFVVILIVLGIFLFSLPTKNIVIKGNTYVKDIEIIETADLKDYPKLFKTSTSKMKKKIKTIPFITSVKIKKNIFGKITIEVVETEILFFYKYNNKYITKEGNVIDGNSTIYGYPTLINFTPDTVFEELVKGFSKIDQNIIKMINEIEYSPYKGVDGTIIDDTRFILHMNDANTVVIDTLNIKKLNDYTKIYVSLNMDQNKGTLYLDTITEENIYFEIYKDKEEVKDEVGQE